MSAAGLNHKVRAELRLLLAQRLLRDDQVARLEERYPTEPWDLISLARWLTLAGAVAVGVGVVLLAGELESWRTLLELTLAALTLGALGLGRWLERTRQLTRTRAALELTASLILQGLTTELAVHYSSGSENWPGLVGVQAGLALALAYGLGNRLVLAHSLVCVFVFFGGETGYVSGWGAYWLGMSYPLRFTAIGLATLGVAWAHGRARDDARRSFSRVYLHFGLLIVHLSLWFFALFGYVEKELEWRENAGQRVVFSLVWAAASLGSMVGAQRLGLGTLRTYGVVFLVIDVYTFYFQFVAARSAEAWWLHLLLAGGSLVALALRAEKRRRAQRAQADAEQARAA